MSVEIYDKFQRAASIKRKLSSELGFSPAPELTLPRRAVPAHIGYEQEERDGRQQGLTVPLARNGALAMNGFEREEEIEKGEVSPIKHLK